MYVDAETGLESMVEAPHRLRGQEKRLTTHYRDYRLVDGLMVPHLLESRVEGAPYSSQLTITAVQVNKPLADARFGRPDAVAAPVRRSSR